MGGWRGGSVLKSRVWLGARGGGHSIVAVYVCVWLRARVCACGENESYSSDLASQRCADASAAHTLSSNAHAAVLTKQVLHAGCCSSSTAAAQPQTDVLCCAALRKAAAEVIMCVCVCACVS